MGGAAVGVVVTTGFAIADTVKAVKKVEEKKPETKIELLKTVAPCYVRTGTSLVMTSAFIFGAKYEYGKQLTNLASTVVLSERALKEYEEATKEVVGEEKEQEIRDKIAEKQLQKTPYVNREIFVEEDDLVRCYEPITRAHFLSNKSLITQSMNRLNAQMLGDMCLGFVEWLYDLGLPDYNPEFFLGTNEEKEYYEDIGWNIDNMIDIGFSSQLCTDGVPELVIYYKNRPESEYTNWSKFK